VTPRLFVRRAARADIAEPFRWYEARSTGLGHEFLRAVRVAFAAIERAPEQFPVAVDDIRKVGLRRFPYIVYYVVLRRGTSVIAVMHGRRHPRRWQSRR
jgi:plasmid stabilization system protein ParE